MKLRRFEPVAGLGGVLLLVSLFQPWYDAVSGWEALAAIDVVLAALALLAIAVPVTSALARGPAWPIAIAVIASATRWIGVLLVAFRLLDNAGPLRAGAWLALAGALIAWIGAWMSMGDESAPGVAPPDVPRRPAPKITPQC